MKKLLLILGFASLLSAAPLTYNTDVTDLGGGKKQYTCHAGHINYKDAQGKLQKIDTTLMWNGRDWVMGGASYWCLIPQYADGTFEFLNKFENANETLKSQPVASHIRGIQDKGSMLYPDAFKGADLRVYALRQGLRKVIVIKAKPAVLTDLTFDFLLTLPVGCQVVNEAKAVWTGTSTLDFSGKRLIVGKEYFNPSYLWDSGKLRQKVPIVLYQSGGKIYLRKTIPASFLAKATYPVFTDHCTDYTAGVGDGQVSYTSIVSWDDAHDATLGSADYESTPCEVGVTAPGGVWGIYRVFCPINTNGVTGTITAATFHVLPSGANDSTHDETSWVNVVQTTQAATDSLIDEDYDQCGSVDDPTEGATRIFVEDMVAETWVIWTLDAIGRGWISKIGYTMLGLREGHDATDESIADFGDVYALFYTSESESCEPYLTITTEEGGEPAVTGKVIIINEE